MISFCKNSLQSILRFHDSDDRRHPSHRCRHVLPPPDRGGLHLLAADSPKPPHVVEAPGVGAAAVGRKPADPGAWGLHEAAGGSGIGLCTESLGSESCDNDIEIDAGDEITVEIDKRTIRRPLRRRKEEMRFPPPLPWMIGGGGRLNRFLKADRRDGRFVLTEIRIDPPPAILRAFRVDGRLRLEVIGSELGGGLEVIRLPKEEEESAEPLDNGVEEQSEFSKDEESKQNEERWTLPRVRNEGQRCVETGIGDGSAPVWWSHRFVTTA